MKKKFKIFVLFFVLCLMGWIFPALPRAQEKKITNHLGMDFILVNPGSFMMGSPKDEPHRDGNEILHKMKISRPFYLQSTEVTIQQWEAVVGKNIFFNKKGTKNTPVTRVSFYDCQKFIKKLNAMNKGIYRLPTEAEWEYACRAGTATAYSWGDTIDCSKAMYANNSKKESKCINYFKPRGFPQNQAAPVKSFAPNPWGFYDMHGNVWEWCADPYQDYKTKQFDQGYDPIKTGTRVKRGGSWYKYGWYCRSANRAYAHPGAKFQTTGFRLVLEADE
ncbi:formylglycine-generating enzyme family protein [Desulfobacula sp.]